MNTASLFAGLGSDRARGSRELAEKGRLPRGMWLVRCDQRGRAVPKREWQ